MARSLIAVEASLTWRAPDDPPEDAIFEPKPLRRDLPIWVGGNTAAAARRAGQLGDAWLPMNIALDDFRAGVAALEASAVGRRRPLIALQAGFRVDEAGKQTPVHDPLLASYVYMSGTPDAIVEQLEPYRQVGLDYVVCIFSADSVDNMLHQMQVFAEQVMPHFVDA